MSDAVDDEIDFNDPRIANLPRILLMGPRRAGKTSIQGFSRVVQKLIPQLPVLDNLLNVLVSRCAMEKAYLFDVASKLYISTDSSLVDMQSVELCSDMIDVVLDVSGIYGLPGGGNEDENVDDTAEGTDYVDDPEAHSIMSGAQDGEDADSIIPSCGGGEAAFLTSADEGLILSSISKKHTFVYYMISKGSYKSLMNVSLLLPPIC